jgi:class 3 adenylate cyclase
MALADDLKSEVASIFATNWKERDGQVIPEPEDVKLGNDAIKLSAAILYADLADSTGLVNSESKTFAAEIYKSYLHCASAIIRAEGGAITAFDGDRVMGVFIGNAKNSSAARCALKINHAVSNIINPAIRAQYSTKTYSVSHAVGVDTSDVLVARTGVWGANDLVWVGRAANYAAKLCSLRSVGYTAWITESIFNNMHKDSKYGGANADQLMWKEYDWTGKGIKVHGSNWLWKP